MGRDGVTPDSAREALRSDTTLIGCMLLRRGDADALVCGTTGSYDHHFEHVQNLIGLKNGASLYAAMNILLLLIPLSLLLLVAAIWAFVWAVKRGQFDDLDTPAIDILRDDDARTTTQPRDKAGDDAD